MDYGCVHYDYPPDRHPVSRARTILKSCLADGFHFVKRHSRENVLAGSPSASDRPFRGVLFDKDGTLIDFDATWIPAYRSAAERVADIAGDPSLAARLMERGGWDNERQSWRPASLLTSASNDEIVNDWMDFCGFVDRARFRTLIFDTFHEMAVEYASGVRGIERLLSELKTRGFALGVATMDDERTARSTLSNLGLDSLTDFVCGADSGFGVKPGTGMFEAFCQQALLAPGEVIVVGDSPHDLNMGRSAGAGLVVGVLSGAHGAEDLRELADVVLEDATHLAAFLDRG
jgi:phosphoglycolate phosphatase